MARSIDDETGLVFLVKRPTEDRKYPIDFAAVVAKGITIVTVDSVVVVAGGKVTEVDPLSTAVISVSGTKATIRISAGTHGEDYEVSLSCTDSVGDKVVDDVMVKVRNAGINS